jgi:hypothetical protein
MAQQPEGGEIESIACGDNVSCNRAGWAARISNSGGGGVFLAEQDAYAVAIKGSGRPGVYGSSGAGIGVKGTSTNGAAVWGRSTNSYGVHGRSDNSVAVLAEGYKGVEASGDFGVSGAGSSTWASYGGDFEGAALLAYGVHGENLGIGYGGYFIGNDFGVGVYADGGSDDSFQYDGYFPDEIYVGGMIYDGTGLSVIAVNAGGEALAPGDLVSFAGFDRSAYGSIGALQVQRAYGADGAVVGVVRSSYAVDPLPEVPVGELNAEEREVAERILSSFDTGHFTDGNAEPGGYVVIGIEGIAEVAVHGGAPIQAGNWVVVTTDSAVTSVPASEYVAALEQGHTIVGRALESLESGNGSIFVRLDLR